MVATRPLYPRVPIPSRLNYAAGAHPLQCAAHNAEALATANLAHRWHSILVALGLDESGQYPDQLAEWAYLATPWLMPPQEDRYRGEFAWHYRRAVVRQVLRNLETVAERIDALRGDTRPTLRPFLGRH